MKAKRTSQLCKLLYFRVQRELTRRATVFAVICVSIYFYNRATNIADICRLYHYTVTLPGYVFLTNDSIVQLVINISALVLFSHAPFRDELYEQIVIRTGRSIWTCGNILSELLLSLIWTSIPLAVFIIRLLPYIDWRMIWGQAWRELARNGVSSLEITVLPSAIRSINASTALACSLITEFLCIFLLGLCIHVGNCISRHKAGTYTAAVIILLDITIWNALPDTFTKYSPVSLTKISTYASDGTLIQLDIRYGLIFYCISIMLCLLALIISEHYIYGRFNRDEW